MSQEPSQTEQTKKRLLELANEKLKGKRGPAYWRSLEEVVDTDEFQVWLEDEFPNRKEVAMLDRRSLLKFMGASMALAGLSGCRSLFLPDLKLAPLVHQPEEMMLGKSLFYATTIPHLGYGFGVLCSQREGRPIKLEGNPAHPTSLGSIPSMVEAEMLNVYDPDRMTNVITAGNISTWDQLTQLNQGALKAQKAKAGAGLRFLTETVTSPTIAAQIKALLKSYPQAKWHVYDAIDGDGSRLGVEQATGKAADVRYDLSQAKTIVSLDSDFMLRRPDSTLLARQWADGRRVTGKDGSMNRLYVVESTMTITGAAAEHRWPVKPSEVQSVAQAIAAGLGLCPQPVACPIPNNQMAALVKDLLANPGAVVIPGEMQNQELHSLCLSINQKLGAIGKSVILTEPVDYNPTARLTSISDLVNDLNQGEVDVLYILGGNPVYTAPADLNFASAISKAKFKVYLTQFESETSDLVDWSAPMAHPLEAWGDWRAVDGAVGLAQPLFEPLHDGWSTQEFLSSLVGPKTDGYEILKSHYSDLSEDELKTAICDGLIDKPVYKAQPPMTVAAMTGSLTIAPPPTKGVELRFKPCGKIWDGVNSNNGWLRELPDNITKLTWDNVVEMSPAMALREGLDSGDLIELSQGPVTVTAPVWIQPGQPDGALTVTLGYGRKSGGVVATDEDANGFDANVFRTVKSRGFYASDAGISFKTVPGSFRFANVQMHGAMEARDFYRQGTLEEFKKSVAAGEKPFRFADEDEVDLKEMNLYPETIFRTGDLEQWGMTIDLNVCTGCNACVTACQSENNIAVVGKDQVARGREMHWIRLDRYYGSNERTEYENASQAATELQNPTVSYMPVMCVHCEKAPCEAVCPVAATVHSHDGLNQMIYNRCIGTRYCSDNCPYKVRRFNFLNYQFNQPNFSGTDRIPLLKMLNNPDVTVRSRGVMEKCTYCVERISDARIEAKKSGLPIRDGAIVTACQQACPTRAITFGNILDQKAAVVALRNDPRSYLLLDDLNTRPRTSHMARLRNPNPEITA